jgi:uncharacterized protein YjbJ (UPF0337 family)
MHTRMIRSTLALASVAGTLLACQNSETAKGDATKMKGQAEQAAGDVTGSDSLKAAGKGDQTKGKVQQTVGKVEHAVNP